MLSKDTIEKILITATENGGDFAEVFIEDSFTTNLQLVGGYVERIVTGRDAGIGIRIFKDLEVVYVSTNNLEEKNLINLAKKASEAIKTGDENLKFQLKKESFNSVNPIIIYPRSIELVNKIDLLKEGYKSAKSYSDLIEQVTVNYLDTDQKVLIANTDGIYRDDRRIRTRYSVSAIASKNGQIQPGIYSTGASMGFEFFKEYDVNEIAREASRIAVKMVDADYAPSGSMPVIIDNEFGGVLFHEACGHSLEASFISRGTSQFTGKLGMQIASPLVTAIDDGTLKNSWGSTNIDDEGNKTQKNILIENGVLKSYLIDKFNARRMNAKSTSSSRRESYKYQPTSRMNNTYIDGGDTDLEDMISNTDYGLYAKKLGGGSVNPATGDFNFVVNEGYLIENGKIKKPVKGASIVGNGGEVLMNIDMVGKDLKLGQGMCGAASGSIPVSLGQPPVRVSKLTVGGRS